MATFFIVVRGNNHGRGHVFLKTLKLDTDKRGKSKVSRTWTAKVRDAMKFSHRYQAKRVAEATSRARVLTEREAFELAKRVPTTAPTQPVDPFAWIVRQVSSMRPGAKGGRAQPLSEKKIERIDALIAAGKSDEKIAEEVGATRHQVYYLRSKRQPVTQ